MEACKGISEPTTLQVTSNTFCGKFLETFKDTLKGLAILKTIKKVYEKIFFDIQKQIYSESLYNALCVEIKSQR